MISRQGQIIRKRAAIGDAAVDGLFSGLGAGLVMAVVLVLLGMARGEGPVSVLSRFSGSDWVTPWTGLLSHLAVSGIYGILFGMLVRWALPYWRNWSWLMGLIYGALLFVLAALVILPGTHSLLRGLPAWEFGLAHLVYGAVLGTLAARNHKNTHLL